jgi:TPR repeat protein
MKSTMSRVAMSIGVVLFSISLSVSASNYNEGFIAAESGNYQSAMKTWGPLAEQGHAVAQFNLALLYHSGSGISLDEKKAVEWYRKSAQNGYYKAQEYMAVGYREGWFGLPKDSEKAEYWEKKLEENIH